ncbi:hypothetical protein C2S52_011744 [Perilla frutescens var. hirtella]|nr:hypothetical protein C2S52_011744 [Perilla frutescens var. hirtella]KAH6785631.1 hypothetical protein C2S51_038086 [Perilla frutescens var. frutescens]
MMLINPELPHGYISENQFLTLTEGSPPSLKLTNRGKLVSSFKSSKGQSNFVKGETMYIVSDDLTVTPFTVTSSISIPHALGISLSDVKELDLHIGMEEALHILKASLSSTTVLTDALINPMLNKLPKPPKQER